VWFSLEDAAEEAKFRENLIGEIKKSQVAVDKVNKLSW